MFRKAESTEIRATLAAAWESLPESERGPTQFLGRQNAGCGAIIGAMPKCDFSCTGCYLNKEANSQQPKSLAEIEAQLRRIREWLGPAGNVQITDGEVSLRDPEEVIHMIAYARSIGLVPMLMSHGETFRRHPGLLERYMVEGGLSELSLHIDTTQRGRRDDYAGAGSERELDALRDEFAGIILNARRKTGLPLEVASTVTVTRGNLPEVAGIVRWFIAHAGIFKMLSFQPLAQVGRTRADLRGITPDELWQEIGAGCEDPEILKGGGSFGHSACTRFVQGWSVQRRKGFALVPFYRRDRPDEMEALGGMFERIYGLSFRLDNKWQAFRKAAGLLIRNAGFVAGKLLPQLIKFRRRTGGMKGHYFCIVSHHFMNAEELETPLGKERLDACAFRVPINGEMQPMCSVNALSIREDYYQQKETAAA